MKTIDEVRTIVLETIRETKADIPAADLNPGKTFSALGLADAQHRHVLARTASLLSVDARMVPADAVVQNLVDELFNAQN